MLGLGNGAEGRGWQFDGPAERVAGIAVGVGKFERGIVFSRCDKQDFGSA